MKKIIFILAFLVSSIGFSQEVIGYYLDEGVLTPIMSGSSTGDSGSGSLSQTKRTIIETAGRPIVASDLLNGNGIITIASGSTGDFDFTLDSSLFADGDQVFFRVQEPSTAKIRIDISGANLDFQTIDDKGSGMIRKYNDSWQRDGNLELYTPAVAENLGSELVLDPSFDTGTPWLTQNGSTDSGGSATAVGSGNPTSTAANHVVYQDGVFDETATKNYRVTFTASTTVGSGTVYVGYGFVTPFAQVLTGTPTEYTFDVTGHPIGGTPLDRLVLGADSGTTAVFTEISVKEILP